MTINELVRSIEFTPEFPDKKETAKFVSQYLRQSQSHKNVWVPNADESDSEFWSWFMWHKNEHIINNVEDKIDE